MIQGVAAKWSFSSLSANKGVNQQVTRFTPFVTPKNIAKDAYFYRFLSSVHNIKKFSAINNFTE